MVFLWGRIRERGKSKCEGEGKNNAASLGNPEIYDIHESMKSKANDIEKKQK